MYRIPAKPSIVRVSGKTVRFDSQNEARLAEWLEANGFSGLWSRSGTAVANGGSRYTGNFELSVLHDGRTKRAIVEAKPSTAEFTPSIARRMLGTASYYKTDLLLLFVRDKNAWYLIDSRDGSLSAYGTPVPGKLPLRKLAKSFSLTAEKRGGRYYERRFNPLGWVAELVIGVVQGPKPK